LTPRDKKISREIHIIREKAFWFKPKIRRMRELQEKEFSISEVTFKAFHESDVLLERLLRIIRRYKGDLRMIKHIAMVPSTNRIYLNLRPKPGELKKFLKLVLEELEL